ncbi:MAG: aspartyl/asparaginyl beta-hydroxylase domain-containing protein [Proteobacteria bacterium]|nr:aspartyl/asparaginyl beta-hydroxylase domain-containing protein [Pseudomonadota bacterium]
MSRDALIRAADEAAARGDLTLARAQLEQAVAAGSDDGEPYLKLAAVCRALGEPQAALGAVERALAIDPLSFMALMLKGSLLDQLGDPMAGEVFGWALAQLPQEPLPPELFSIVAHARQRHEASVSARELAMERAMDSIGLPADSFLAFRLARFRSNAVRRTRHWHSEPSDYQYPGLAEFEFFDEALFPWLSQLESATAAIRDEFRATIVAERGVPYIQYPEGSPLRQWTELNHNRDWTALHLMQNGKRIEENARHCPKTMALLETLPQPQVPNCSPNAMFSLLAPNTMIPPHVGVNNTRLVCHLPLIVPEGCWFRVGGETRVWEEGKALIFDDTIEHEAVNPSASLRVVLIFDVWHCDLSAYEQQALSAMLATDVVRAPGL